MAPVAQRTGPCPVGRQPGVVRNSRGRWSLRWLTPPARSPWGPERKSCSPAPLPPPPQLSPCGGPICRESGPFPARGAVVGWRLKREKSGTAPGHGQRPSQTALSASGWGQPSPPQIQRQRCRYLLAQCLRVLWPILSCRSPQQLCGVGIKLHFADEETEVSGGEETCLRSAS